MGFVSSSRTEFRVENSSVRMHILFKHAALGPWYYHQKHNITATVIYCYFHYYYIVLNLHENHEYHHSSLLTCVAQGEDLALIQHCR